MSSKFLWDFWSKYYDKLWVQKYSLKPTRRCVLDMINRNTNSRSGLKLLDVGCGIGELLRDLRSCSNERFESLFGVDYSKSMIERAIKMGDGIGYECMDSSHVKNRFSGLDIIVCTHSFPYYEDQREALAGFHSCLKEGGDLMLAQASENSIYDKLALFFVKFTTGKASYPSSKKIHSLSDGIFEVKEEILIRERFFMPSIILFHLVKKGGVDIEHTSDKTASVS